MVDRILTDSSRITSAAGFRGAFKLLLSPSFFMLKLFRLSHWLHRSGARVAARLVRNLNLALFSCDIAPTADIAPGVLFPHPLGIVVGKQARIGTGTTIFQNVTLGAKSLGATGYPMVGEFVTLFPGVVVVGQVVIGDGATIGANSVVLTDVPPGTTAAGSPARVIAIS